MKKIRKFSTQQGIWNRYSLYRKSNNLTSEIFSNYMSIKIANENELLCSKIAIICINN